MIKVSKGLDKKAGNKYSLDIIDINSIKNLAKILDEECIEVNYLITCPFPDSEHHGMISYEPFEAMSDLEWDTNLDYSLRAPSLFCKVFGKKMQNLGKGSIIQLVSNVAVDPHDIRHFKNVKKNNMCGYPSAAYTCASAGIIALTRHLAAVYQDSGILINNIIYGPIKDTIPKSLEESYIQRIPMGRIMSIDDLTNAVDLLLDPKSNYITGQNIRVDGGVSIW